MGKNYFVMLEHTLGTPEPVFLGIHYGTHKEAVEMAAEKARTDTRRVTAVPALPENGRILLVEHCGQVQSICLVFGDGGADVSGQVENAVQLAKNLGEQAWISTMPDSYLEKQGLSVLHFPALSVDDQKLFTSNLEKLGIRMASCRNCIKFDEGFCLKYYQRVDPKGDNNCFSGDEIYQLCYTQDGQTRCSYYLHSEEPLWRKDIPKILDALEADKDEKLALLKDSIRYDTACWQLLS